MGGARPDMRTATGDVKRKAGVRSTLSAGAPPRKILRSGVLLAIRNNRLSPCRNKKPSGLSRTP